MVPLMQKGMIYSGELLKRETARCAAYRLLHTIYSYPGPETVHFLKAFTLSPESHDLMGLAGRDAQKVFGSIADMMHRGISDSLLDLEVEYTRLFINSFNGTPAKPYESVHVNKGHLVIGETTVRVREFYRQFGVDLGRYHPEPADHIAIETEFMAYLIDRELNAYMEGELEKADRFRDAQIRFLQQHLLCWAWNFSDQVYIHSQHPFYREAGLFSKIWFDGERRGVE